MTGALLFVLGVSAVLGLIAWGYYRAVLMPRPYREPFWPNRPMAPPPLPPGAPPMPDRQLKNAWGIVPVGTIGQVDSGGASSWTKLSFTANSCPSCGVQAIIGGCSKSDFELLPPVPV